MNETEIYPRIDFRNGARGVMTWVEIHGTEPVPSSLEILRPARELADALGTQVTSVLIGAAIRDRASDVIAQGADRVVVIEDPRLAEYLVLPYARVFTQLIERSRPEIALFGATTSGRELAPRLANRIRAGVTADCTHLKVGDFFWKRQKAIMYPCLEAIRPSYGESKLATIVGFWCPQMATARPGAFRALPKDLSRQGEIRDFLPIFEPGDFAVEVLETVREEAGAKALLSADIVVTGGRPCGELDQFYLVRELVEELQRSGVAAEWGASRQAVDAGYAPHERQIGQTGKMVRPKIYLAVAVSGAVQHLAGMKDSEKIIAINKDPGAPIFRSADFGLVGDYRDVLTALIDRVRSGFTFGLSAASVEQVVAAEACR